jgi:hypothetical protein
VASGQTGIDKEELPMTPFRTARRHLRIALAAALLSSVAVTAAEAMPIYVATNSDFSTTPATITLGPGDATYVFTYIATSPYDYTADSVSTGGTALVNSSGFPGPGQQPIPFQIDSLIGANGYDTFTAFPTGAGIDYSIANVFIGLKFTLSDGDHFGFAQLAGPTLIGYGYDDVPNTPIAAVDVNSAVPEPETLALFLAGLMLLAAMTMKFRTGPGNASLSCA